jgi:hypothetical protein
MLESLEIDHGNIKLSNVFIEFAEKRFGDVQQRVPVIYLSDRNLVGKPKSDSRAFADIMH